MICSHEEPKVCVCEFTKESLTEALKESPKVVQSAFVLMVDKLEELKNEVEDLKETRT